MQPNGADFARRLDQARERRDEPLQRRDDEPRNESGQGADAARRELPITAERRSEGSVESAEDPVQRTETTESDPTEQGLGAALPAVPPPVKPAVGPSVERAHSAGESGAPALAALAAAPAAAPPVAPQGSRRDSGPSPVAPKAAVAVGPVQPTFGADGPPPAPVEAVAMVVELPGDRPGDRSETAPSPAAHAIGHSSEARALSAAGVPQGPDAPATPPTSTHALNERATQALEQIRLRVEPGMRQATIELSPKELGRVDVRVVLERDGLVAHLRVEAIDTYRALERHMPELRAGLEQGGLDVIRLDLSMGERGSQASDDFTGARKSTAHVEATSESNTRQVENFFLRPRTVTDDTVDLWA